MDVIVFHAELCTLIELLPDSHVTLSQKTAMCGFHTGHSEGLMPSSSGGWPGQRGWGPLGFTPSPWLQHTPSISFWPEHSRVSPVDLAVCPQSGPRACSKLRKLSIVYHLLQAGRHSHPPTSSCSQLEHSIWAGKEQHGL